MLKEMILYFTSLFTTPKILLVIGTATITLLIPVAPLIHTVLFLVLVDLITGFLASLRTNKIPICLLCMSNLKHISSLKMGRTLTKILLYVLLIISCFLVDQYVLAISTPIFLKVVASAIAIREIISIIENVSKVTNTSIKEFIVAVLEHGVKGAFKAKAKSDIK